MTAKTILKGAVPVVAGVMITGLLFRYLGDKPVIEDAVKGLKGDVSGKLFG